MPRATPVRAAPRRLAVVVVAVAGALVAPFLLAAAPAPATGAVYVVKRGDTVSGVAARHGVSAASVVTANHLTGPRARLLVGRRLTIPPAGAAVVRARTPAAVASAKRSTPPPRTLVLAVPDFAELVLPFAWPVDGQLSSPFGRRRTGWHRGIDIVAEPGTPVLAAAPGTVVRSTYETRYGLVVKIEHANGFMTVYAHNDENLVEVGDRVSAGQAIAGVGRTGRATSPHVHFEIRQAGLAYNPLYMLPLPPRVVQVAETDDEDHDDGDE